MHFRYSLWFVCMCCLAACNTTPTDTAVIQPADASPSPVLQQTASPIPTVSETTPIPSEQLTIWWPDKLIANDTNDLIDPVFAEQLQGFEASRENTRINYRLKRINETGGIMQTMRAAQNVAPSAQPDLTLMQRENLLLAVQLDLIQPLEGIVPSAVLSNLYDSAIEMGQVNETLYGLPYTLELQFLAYDPERIDLPSSSFEDILTNEVAYTFPAERTNGISTVFLVQYLTAGGTINEEGQLTFDPNALEETLQFYEQAVAIGLIDDSVVEYEQPADYVGQIGPDEIAAAVITSDVYLNLLDDGYVAAPLPTESGQASTALNGWMWVMVTEDTNRQAEAARFLEWVMEIDRQGEYVQSLAMLPSQRNALRRWYNDPLDLFLADIMENAYLPLPEPSGGTVARAMQTALIAVISGERTAEEATQDVLDQLAN